MNLSLDFDKHLNSALELFDLVSDNPWLNEYNSK